MNLFIWDYVGHDQVDTTLNIQAICRIISTIKRVWNIGGRVYTDTPDKLYDKFTHLFVGITDDTTSWSIQFYSCYLSAFTKYLAEETTSNRSFVMPKLSTLTSKAL